MTKETKKVSNIWQKIFNIQQKVSWIGKEGWNDFNKYKYALEIDIIGEIKPLLNEERLVIITSVVGKDRVISKEEKIMTELDIEYTIVSIDNPDEKISSIGIGQGQDKGDKGSNKAQTGGLKYFLMKTFMIPARDESEEGKKKKTKESKEEQFEMAKSMIKASRNISGLIDYAQKLKTSKFTEFQKRELNMLISKKVDNENKTS